jgi:hypothetical protein
VRKHRRSIPLRAVLAHIDSICALRLPLANRSAARTEINNQESKVKNPPTLLIEGVGGLLVPLGERYTVLDLITELARQCTPATGIALDVLVVSRNQLGTINHTLLTMQALQKALGSRVAIHTPRTKVILMASRSPDASSASNSRILDDLLPSIPVIPFPFLGPKCSTPASIKALQSRTSRSLAQILA